MLATVCGLLVFSLITGIVFIAVIAGMAASGSSTTEVKDNSVFVLKLDGLIDERGKEDSPLDMLMNKGDMSMMGLDDITLSIRKAAKEKNIKGIYIEGGTALFDSPATAQQIRDAQGVQEEWQVDFCLCRRIYSGSILCGFCSRLCVPQPHRNNRT